MITHSTHWGCGYFSQHAYMYGFMRHHILVTRRVLAMSPEPKEFKKNDQCTLDSMLCRPNWVPAVSQWSMNATMPLCSTHIHVNEVVLKFKNTSQLFQCCFAWWRHNYSPIVHPWPKWPHLPDPASLQHPTQPHTPLLNINMMSTLLSRRTYIHTWTRTQGPLDTTEIATEIFFR